VQLTLDRGDVGLFAEPFDGDCPRCLEPILVVEVARVDVVVERDEVLGQFPCPVCAQVAAKGHRRHRCVRCGDTGVCGVPLPPFGVAVDPEGRARYFTGRRDEGEAVYHEHACRLPPRRRRP
jgi:hypothetical protein